MNSLGEIFKTVAAVAGTVAGFGLLFQLAHPRWLNSVLKWAVFLAVMSVVSLVGWTGFQLVLARWALQTGYYYEVLTIGTVMGFPLYGVIMHIVGVAQQHPSVRHLFHPAAT
jgi:hypothetical protein